MMGKYRLWVNPCLDPYWEREIKNEDAAIKIAMLKEVVKPWATKTSFAMPPKLADAFFGFLKCLKDILNKN